MLKSLKSKIALASVAAGSMAMSAASYAIDTTAVGTAITAAETDALTTGEFVIGTVASLVVVGLIIGLVKKL